MRRLDSEQGFTLIELLVVVLIIGILSAIALPAFLSQRAKAQDAEAKVYLVAAQKALEVYHQDHDTYAGADKAKLAEIEPSLTDARNMAVNGTDVTFDVGIDSASVNGGKRFLLAKLADEHVERTCENPGKGACADDGTW